MQSAVFLAVFATAVITGAAPTSVEERSLECPGTGAYYVCSNNGFRGYCSADPCNMAWCPDFTQKTCDKKWGTPTTSTSIIPTTTTPPAVYTPSECSGTGNYYVCSNNGFRGYCSADPCNMAWCPDFALKTRNKIVRTTTSVAPEVSKVPEEKSYTPSQDETVCSVGTGFFQSCSNGFRGCCKRDACSAAWCPDYKFGTYQPISTSTPEALTWVTLTTAKPPVKTASSDSSVCGNNQGYFQVCANGFKGCCKTDACSLGFCPSS